jgi:hypothetical protein
MENTEENQIIEKQDNAQIYLKNFLIIYGIWIVLNIIIFLICYHSQLKETFLQAIGCILAAPFAFIIVFSPAIIISWLLFKKIINPYWRCVLVSLLIPLNNVIYYIIEYKLNIPFTFTQAPVNYTIIIGICSLCWILPMTFITLLSTPKEILKCKWYAVLTVVLIFILGWIIAYYTLLLPLTYL